MTGTPVSALASARRMCERSDWTLTNLQLQKMMYLAQMFHLGQKGDRLFNGGFEAWDFGPVLPSVYHQVKMYGRDRIEGGFFGVGAVNDPERAKMLDDACDQLSKMSAPRLVDITHWSEGAWAKNYTPGQHGILIPDADIVNEYKRRLTLQREQKQRR